MARRIVSLLIIAALPVFGANLPQLQNPALAAGLDQQGKADAKAAMGLFRQGLYEEAARIFAKLSVDYPDMEIFERNLGACLFYLRRPEPALSNLRRYLSRKKNIAPDDKAVVDRWIDEMEKLRAQNVAASVSPPSRPLPAEPTPPVNTAAGESSASVPPQALPTPQTKNEGTAQADSAQGSTAPSIAPKPGEVANAPPGLDLSVNPGTNNSTKAGQPIYKTWWFWTGAVAVVAAGAVTAFLIAGRSNSPCAGASMACLEAK